MGIAVTVVNVAVVSGPTISGLLLEFAGYWITWTVPLVVLVIDLVARLLLSEDLLTHLSPLGTENDEVIRGGRLHKDYESSSLA
ncbi:Tetracycline resistance protein TetA/multidrug resistance protein MdtG [Penicillium tannophilum]|nr:Tetracycline resistance protein TetA/multidrug resistance protein MdtG [Penicillium tannophilum]